METSPPNRREFARIPVRLGARFRIVGEEEADDLNRTLSASPSVWAPEGESELLKLASRASAGAEGVLARALLDIGQQLSRVTHHTLSASGPAAWGEFEQLSGGGGLFATDASLVPGALLDMRLASEDPAAPLIRVLGEVVRGHQGPNGPFPLRFNTIHPSDRERLIRYIHSLQRRQLREAHQRA